jgi:hypothetical protein
MKNLLSLLFAIPFIAFAQSPQGINYQAVAYDSDGFELSNKEVGVRISIVEGSAFGTPQLVEEHDVITTEQGLFSLIIGQGALLGGEVSSLLDIPWGSNTYFLKIELDTENNGSYMDFGTQQFMSVPYALYAESSGAVGPEGPEGPQGEPADSVDYDSLANMISIDSTFLASVSGGIGGCNFLYPEGINGMAVTGYVDDSNPYIVPSGKRFYLLTWRNGDFIPSSIAPVYMSTSSAKPFILNSGESLSTTETASYFNGFLVDETTGLQSITGSIDDANPYVVPFGKRFYLLTWKNGDFIPSSLAPESMWTSETKPFILNSGESLSTNQTNGLLSFFHGYLVDEDYFAGCGGGGSSSNESSSLDSAMVADMIAASGGGGNMVFGDFQDITSLINDNIPSSPEFQQTEDGFIYIYLNPTNLARYFNLSVDSITPLGFDFMSMYGANKAYYTDQYAVTPIIFPIKKNYYWSFEAHEDLTVWKAFWIPLESNPPPSNDSDSENMLAEIQEQINALDSITTLFDYKFELMNRPLQESLDLGVPISELLSSGFQRQHLYGLFYNGGYIFHIDSSGTGGLIALDDVVGSYYGYQCYSFSNEFSLNNGGYLPSKDEFTLLYTNLGQGSFNGSVITFEQTNYWTSSGVEAFNVTTGLYSYYNDIDGPFKVRLIRDF